MGQSSYPDELALREYIQSLHVLNPATEEAALCLMHLERKVAAVSADWEGRTGWKPYLAEVNPVTRYSDAARGVRSAYGWVYALDLNGGWQEIDVVMVGRSADDEGHLLREDQDYFLVDGAGEYVTAGDGIAFDGSCIEEIHFVTAPHISGGLSVGGLKSIAVTGRRGRFAEVPDDTYEFLLHQAAYLAYQELSLQISNGLYSIRDVNSEIRYSGGGVTPLSAESAKWVSDYEGQILQEKRVVM